MPVSPVLPIPLFSFYRQQLALPPIYYICHHLFLPLLLYCFNWCFCHLSHSHPLNSHPPLFLLLSVVLFPTIFCSSSSTTILCSTASFSFRYIPPRNPSRRLYKCIDICIKYICVSDTTQCCHAHIYFRYFSSIFVKNKWKLWSKIKFKYTIFIRCRFTWKNNYLFITKFILVIGIN